MDSSAQESSQRDTPRELDLFGEEALEEILDSYDSLRAQIEQLQLHCEKLVSDKAAVDQLLIEKEKENQLFKEKLQEDISKLRKLNIQLLSSQNATDKDLSHSSGLLKEIFDSDQVYRKKLEADAKVDALQLKLLEKDKHISNLEWQLVDSDATIASLQAERDRLALELDCTSAREQESDLQSLGAVGDISGYADPLENSDYGLVESGFVDDMPVRRVRKQPRRHLSDLTTRGTSYFDDFGAIVAGHVSLSDYDVPTLTDKESYGLGSLRRATNFSNINNIDPCEKFDSVTPQSSSSNVQLQDWESFDESDAVRLSLNRNKWDRFSEVCDVKDSGGSDPKRDKDDMWTFTPDSIINVSTGEELSPLPGESNFFQRFSKESDMPSNENTHRGATTIQRTESMPADRRRVDINSGVHHKTASQPISKTDSFIHQTNNNTQASNNNKNTSNKKLEEYHKWKVSGCKGDPPAKLKISQ